MCAILKNAATIQDFLERILGVPESLRPRHRLPDFLPHNTNTFQLGAVLEPRLARPP